MAKERIKWLDTAKGIGIVLVVLGHVHIPDPAGKYIFAFHIPLFFLVSGYLFGMMKPTGFAGFLKKKTRSLIVPYVAFFLILYIYVVAIGSRYGENTPKDFSTPIKGLFFSSADYITGIFTPMWFLPCLFTTEMMFFWISRLFKKWYALALVGCSALGFFGSVCQLPAAYLHYNSWLVPGFIGSLHFSFRLPWGLDIAFTAVVFYGVGRAVCGLKSAGRSALWGIVSIPAFLAVNYFACMWNEGSNLRNNYYGNYFLFYIAAFAGVFGYVLIARLLQWFTPLVYMGRNSLTIFALHFFVMGMIRGFVRRVLKYPVENLAQSIPWAIFLTIACMLALVPVIYVLNKYLYFILGKPRPGKLPAGAARDFPDEAGG